VEEEKKKNGEQKKGRTYNVIFIQLSFFRPFSFTEFLRRHLKLQRTLSQSCWVVTMSSVLFQRHKRRQWRVSPKQSPKRVFFPNSKKRPRLFLPSFGVVFFTVGKAWTELFVGGLLSQPNFIFWLFLGVFQDQFSLRERSTRRSDGEWLKCRIKSKGRSVESNYTY
jgi:hypothetical protein